MSQQELFDYVMNTPHNTNPAILKQKIKDISGASSWNDLTDKPFGEEVVVGEPLEISWDGNTAGLVSVSPDASVTLYKVADDTPTKDQLEKGFTFVVKENIGDRVSREYTTSDVDAFDEEHTSEFYASGSMVGFAVIYKDGAYSYGMTFPEKGLYLAKTWDNNHIVSLKFNFEQQTTVIKTIDEKFIPDTIARVKDIPEAGNADVATEEEVLELLLSMDLVEPITDVSGTIFTDDARNVFIM